MYSLNENFRKEFHDVIPCLFAPIKSSSSANAKPTNYNNNQNNNHTTAVTTAAITTTNICNNNNHVDDDETINEDDAECRSLAKSPSLNSRNGHLMNRECNKRPIHHNFSENIELSRIDSIAGGSSGIDYSKANDFN